MTSAIAICPRAAPGFDPTGSLWRILGVFAESLSRAEAGLQSMSRASMLDAARSAAVTSTRMRRL